MTNLGAGSPDLGSATPRVLDAGTAPGSAPPSAAAERALLDHARVVARLHSATSHELRGQLNALVLNFEVLKELLRSGDTDGEVRQCLRALEAELDRFKPSFESFLRQTRAADSAPQSFDASALVEEACRRVAPVLRHQRAELATSLSAGTVMLRGSRERLLEGIVACLLAGFGRARSTGRVEVTLATRGRCLELSVVTHGAAGAGAVPSPIDTSLLDAARDAIALHGGELRAESHPDGATRIRAEIPVLKESD